MFVEFKCLFCIFHLSFQFTGVFLQINTSPISKVHIGYGGCVDDICDIIQRALHEREACSSESRKYYSIF